MSRSPHWGCWSLRWRQGSAAARSRARADRRHAGLPGRDAADHGGCFLASFRLKAAVPDLGVFTLGTDRTPSSSSASWRSRARCLPRSTRRCSPGADENLALGALAWWVVLSIGLALAAPARPTCGRCRRSRRRASRCGGSRASGSRVAMGGRCRVRLAVLIMIYRAGNADLRGAGLPPRRPGLPGRRIMGLFSALAARLLVPQLGPQLTGRRALLGSRWLAPVAAAALAAVLVAVGVARLGYGEAYPRPGLRELRLGRRQRARGVGGRRPRVLDRAAAAKRRRRTSSWPRSAPLRLAGARPAVDLPAWARARRRASGRGHGLGAAAAAVGTRRRRPRHRVPRIGPILAASVEGRELPAPRTCATAS